MISDNTPTTLNNIHHNIQFAPQKIWRVSNQGADTSGWSGWQYRAEGQKSIQEVLGKADSAGINQVRALGSAWSLSQAANPGAEGWLLQTSDLSYILPTLGALAPESPYSNQNLTLLQCGTLVASANLQLGKLERSLLTCGASNGQTIIGASATGTHGAAINIGSIHDTIAGMHIICSESRHVWIESAEKPLLTPEIASQVFGNQVEFIRDTSVFNAARVSFGSFGIVESVVLETEPLYLLSVHRKKMKWDQALQEKVLNLDFDQEPQKDSSLYHVEVTFDPMQLAQGGEFTPWVTTMYKSVAPAGYQYNAEQKPKNVIVTDPCSVYWGGVAARILPDLMLRGAHDLLAKRFEELDPNTDPKLKPLPLGVLFTDVVMSTQGASAEIGVDIKDTVSAFDAIARAFRKARIADRPFLGPASMRFVKSSDATLAFTDRGTHTCCIEMPGAATRTVPQFYQDIRTELTQANVAFTQHWGQEGDFSASTVEKSYGSEKVESGKKARRQVLNTSALRARYANAMIIGAGLHET
ncbi:MAG: hypothetical protein MK135_00440 [Polyangiaceae bacterium]|nr:hypothetical protein [Polyangiaceae bacterium]